MRTLLLCVLAAALCACGKSANDSASDPSAADPRGGAAAGSSAAREEPAVLGCELAKKCGAAAIAAGAPFTGHGRGMTTAAEDGDDLACNRLVFTLLRATSNLVRAPAACTTDMDALFAAVGKPFDQCNFLRACGDALAELGESRAQQAAMAREVATTAIERGTYGGEVVCMQTWEAMLEQRDPSQPWPQACGGAP